MSHCVSPASRRQSAGLVTVAAACDTVTAASEPRTDNDLSSTNGGAMVVPITYGEGLHIFQNDSSTPRKHFSFVILSIIGNYIIIKKVIMVLFSFIPAKILSSSNLRTQTDRYKNNNKILITPYICVDMCGELLDYKNHMYFLVIYFILKLRMLSINTGII